MFSVIIDCGVFYELAYLHQYDLLYTYGAV